MIRYNNDRISSVGLPSLLIVCAAPLMRLVLHGSGLLSWIIVPCVILTAFNIKKYMFCIGIQAYVIIVSFWMIMSNFYSPVTSGNFSLEDIKVQVCTILMFLWLLNIKETKVLILFSFGVALYFIYCYFYKSDFISGGIRKFIMLQEDVWLDPNMVIASFIIPCIWSVWYLISGRHTALKLLLIVFIGLSIYGAFLGGSRGGLIGIVIGSLYVVYKEFKFNRKMMVRTAFIIFILLILISAIRQYIPEDLLKRMTVDSVSESGGSGRFEIYHNYIDSFFEESSIVRTLFGYGMESCKLILGKSAHNVLIDYMWDLGLLGMIFHVFLICSIVKFCFYSKNIVAISCIIATIIWSFTISTSDQLLYWALLYSCICIANISCARKGEKS